MIKLIANESAEEFLKRLEIENASNPGWAKPYVFRYILPGLVNYDDLHDDLGNSVGNMLVKKEILDRMQNSIIGKPIVNEMHKKVAPEDYKNGRADGIVTATWFNVEDGWYWGEALIWDNETQRNIKSGKYSVSCAYANVIYDSTPGVQADIAYKKTLENAEYTHVAVLTNPRYRGAVIMPKENYRGSIIIKNEKGGSAMKLTFLERVKKMVSGKEEEVINSSEVEGEDISFTMDDGSYVPASKLLEVYNQAKAPKLIELLNGTVNGINDSTILKIGEKECTYGELKKIWAEHKNASDEKDEKDKKDKEERENAEADEKKKKDDDERMNSAHTNGDHKTEVKNCGLCKEAKNKAHFKDNKKAFQNGGNIERPVIETRDEKLARGEKLFGSVKK